MVAYNKHNSWVEVLSEGANCSSDQFVVALCPAANAPVAGNDELADLTTISYTNLSSRNITTSTHAQSGGTYSLVFSDLVLTASGTVATFRYVDIYDDTVSGDPLVAWFDYGGNVDLANGETFTLDFASTFFTLA